MGYFRYDRDKPLPPVDTSWQAWAAVFCAAMTNMSTLGLLYAFGVYVVPLVEDFETGRGDVSWIASIAFVFGFAMGLPAGTVSARYGAHNSIMVSGVVLAVSFVGSSYAQSLWILYITYGCFLGLGVSFAVISSQSVVITWFNKKRGIAVGVASAGSGIGNLAAPIIAQKLMETEDGADNDWRRSVRILGIVCGCLMFLSGLFLRGRPNREEETIGEIELGVASSPNDDKAKSDKELSSASSSTDSSASTQSTSHVSVAVEAGAAGAPKTVSDSDSDAEFTDIDPNDKSNAATATTGKQGPGIVRLAVQHPYYRYFLCLSVFVSLSMNIPVVHLSAYATAEGETSSMSSSLLSVFGGAQIFGRIFYGLAADRYGAVNCMIAGLSIMGVSGILWTTIPYTFAWGVTFALIYGWNLGVVIALPPTILGEVFPSQQIAQLLGFYFTMGAPTGLLGPTIAGYVVDGTDSYFYVGFMTGVPLLLGTPLLWKMRAYRAKYLLGSNKHLYLAGLPEKVDTRHSEEEEEGEHEPADLVESEGEEEQSQRSQSQSRSLSSSSASLEEDTEADEGVKSLEAGENSKSASSDTDSSPAVAGESIEGVGIDLNEYVANPETR